MPYDRLLDRLGEGAAPATTTLPDGSVDRFCRLAAGGRDPLTSLDDFGSEIVDRNRSTFRIRIESTEPGGQAVNVAEQLHALRSDVTCYGHLDHPVLADLPFEAVSMGRPALVDAFNFRDGDVMFVEQTGMDEWTLADLRAVADLEEVFSVDAVACANWISLPGLGPAFHEFGDADLPRVPFFLDPGDVVGAAEAEIERLVDALSALQDTFDVVYNANPREISATAATVAGPDDDGNAACAAAIREAAGIHAAVVHGQDEAIAATADGATVVETLRVEDPARHTGGGDHFSGGLAYGLGAGWDWEPALALGNACASYYVETGEPPGVEEIRSTVEADRAPT